MSPDYRRTHDWSAGNPKWSEERIIEEIRKLGPYPKTSKSTMGLI